MTGRADEQGDEQAGRPGTGAARAGREVMRVTGRIAGGRRGRRWEYGVTAGDWGAGGTGGTCPARA
ncbi:hypothetical protein GCM10027075_60980 [Streptomyces heilongjiangensis]